MTYFFPFNLANRYLVFFSVVMKTNKRQKRKKQKKKRKFITWKSCCFLIRRHPMKNIKISKSRKSIGVGLNTPKLQENAFLKRKRFLYLLSILYSSAWIRRRGRKAAILFGPLLASIVDLTWFHGKKYGDKVTKEI